MKKFLASFAVITLTAAALIGADAPRKAPELAFTVPGQGEKLLSQYKGKVVALEFIFTTCPHCQAWTKVMNGFQHEFGARGFQAIDVAVNPNADLLVENFSRDFQTAFPVGWTMQNQMMSFMGWQDARYVVPQMVLIDRKGMIRYQTPAIEDENWDKLMKEDVLKQHISELLNQNLTASEKSSSGTHVALAKKPS